ncbi:MAG: RluA family pseudouridine synthase [Candidatus Omnitrophica bacterium]|nr:RluA family pseudouridine synthase [Candidatus Omnitrophota bacterium]
MTLTIPPDAIPQRLDRYLTVILPDSSRAQIQKLISGGHIQVDGKSVKPSHRIIPGKKLSIEIPPPAPMNLKPEPIPLKIVYEDKYLLVVNKPAGLVVHPAAGNPSGTLVNALLAHGGRLSSVAGPFKPGIVHRLDKDTSGLLLVAKDDATHRHLSEQFASRKVHRVYLALVQGLVRRQEGVIDAPIGRHPVKRQRMAVRYDATRDAVTRYRVLKRFSTATFLELTPQTGRTHQLRVHLAHLGHPILGDTRYGVQAGPSTGLRAGFPRQALHAHRLGFNHPHSGRWVEFQSPWPEDLAQAAALFP